MGADGEKIEKQKEDKTSLASLLKRKGNKAFAGPEGLNRSSITIPGDGIGRRERRDGQVTSGDCPSHPRMPDF